MAVRYANMVFLTLRNTVKEFDHENTPRVHKIMSARVKAIGRHYCDHQSASYEERVEYHKYCRDNFCDFAASNAEGKKKFVEKKDKDFYVYEEDRKTGKPIKDSMNKIIAKFDSMADVNVMKKLTRWLSQNTNESIHHRLF